MKKSLLLSLFLLVSICTSAEELSTSSPIGEVGVLNGREAMVVELNGEKLAIATMNVGATTTTGTTSFGDGFDTADANNPEITGLSDGWYVPSEEQFLALCEQLVVEQVSGLTYLKWQVTESAVLYFPATVYSSYWGRYYAIYWTTTVYHGLYYDGSSIRVFSPLGGGGNIRPFCALPDDTPTNIVELNETNKPKIGQRYNLMGQPVGKDYKGIVIEDSKKIIVR